MIKHNHMRGNLGATGKVVVMWLKTGSSRGNNLLCKKQGKTAYITPKMVGLLPGHCICGSFSAPGCLLYIYQSYASLVCRTCFQSEAAALLTVLFLCTTGIIYSLVITILSSSSLSWYCSL